MNAHVLLKLFNELRQVNKIRDLSGIISLFRKESNK